jgi:hypothetical protein
MALSNTARRRQEARDRRRLEDAKRYSNREPPPESTPFLYDYDTAAPILGVSPGTVEWLCNTRQLGYFVKSWRHGVYKRHRRIIPGAALPEYMATRYAYKPPRPQKPRKRTSILRAS